MYIQCYTVECLRKQQYISFFTVAGVNVAFNNMKVLSVAISMEQLVPCALV